MPPHELGSSFSWTLETDLQSQGVSFPITSHVHTTRTRCTLTKITSEGASETVSEILIMRRNDKTLTHLSLLSLRRDWDWFQAAWSTHDTRKMNNTVPLLIVASFEYSDRHIFSKIYVCTWENYNQLQICVLAWILHHLWCNQEYHSSHCICWTYTAFQPWPAHNMLRKILAQNWPAATASCCRQHASLGQTRLHNINRYFVDYSYSTAPVRAEEKLAFASCPHTEFSPALINMCKHTTNQQSLQYEFLLTHPHLKIGNTMQDVILARLNLRATPSSSIVI
jgi:hypothetical protein